MSTIDFVQTDCQDLAMHTGVTFLADCLIYQACNNLPNDLTGYTARLLVFKDTDSDIILDIPGTVDISAKGIIHFQVDASVTAVQPIGMYQNHVEITSSGGTVYRLSSGAFEISE